MSVLHFIRVRCCLIFLGLAMTAAGAQTSSFTPSFQLKTLPTPCATGTSATNLVTGDFNGDHKLDLAIACINYGSTPQAAEISVLLGNGDGTFQRPLVTSLASVIPIFNSNILALDVNGDGRTDIIINTPGPYIATSAVQTSSTNLILLLAGADGTLGAPATVATSLPYVAEAVADVNGDGIPDLLLDGGLDFSGLAVMLGNSGGTFSAPTPLPTPVGDSHASIALVADFSGAGKADIVLAGYYGNYILVNQGNGSFQSPVPIPNLPVGTSPVLAGDFNGDGKLDMAATASSGTSALLYVFLGNGDGTFQQPVAPLSILTTNLVGLDLNGDGKLDLAQQDGGLVAFYLSNGDGTFQELAPLNLGASFNPTVVADFNGDGKPDMADLASVAINTTNVAATTAALNGASFAAGEPLAAGSLVSLFGSDFAASSASASAIPLPNQLGGVTVTIAGFPARLLFVGPSQINLQVPWEVTGSEADIIVTPQSGTALPPFHASIGPVSPGIFTFQYGQGQAIATDFQQGSIAGPTGSIPGLTVHPAKVGDVLVILATGLGSVSPAVADGAAAGAVLRNTTVKPQVLIGGVPAPLLFSGLSPQFVGVYQINVTVPQVAAGVVPLQLSMGGIVTSNQVTIAVENP
jgi:uncharacterized protein (TIGR03437 family)